MMGGWMGGYGLLGLLLMVLVWAALFALAIWLVSVLFPRIGRQQQVDETTMSARQILDRRYARGELSREQYQVMVRDLTQETTS
jgi:putative membrane protein